jgi:hypothetical protein
MTTNPNPRAAQYTYAGLAPEFYDEIVMVENSTQYILTFLDHTKDGTNVSGIIEITFPTSAKDTLPSVRRTL